MNARFEPALPLTLMLGFVLLARAFFIVRDEPFFSSSVMPSGCRSIFRRQKGSLGANRAFSSIWLRYQSLLATWQSF